MLFMLGATSPVLGRSETWLTCQTQYAQKAYDAYMSEMSKLGEMYIDMMRDASKPVERASKRFT